MLESNIHLTLYPEYVEIISLVCEGHRPLWRIQEECSFHA